MLKGFFPGTFDPPTLGHLRLIARGSSLCDHLTVGIGANVNKSPILTPEERRDALQKETTALENVDIVLFSGLAAEFAKSLGATLVRGLRSESDFEYEKQMALVNSQMGLETLFLIAEPTTGQISSSLLRELAANGASLHSYIPQELERLLHTRLQERD